jgi:hypothetical protein
VAFNSDAGFPHAGVRLVLDQGRGNPAPSGLVLVVFIVLALLLAPR